MVSTHEASIEFETWIEKQVEEDDNGNIVERELQPFMKRDGIREEEDDGNNGEHLTEVNQWEAKSTYVRRITKYSPIIGAVSAWINKIVSKPHSSEILPREIHGTNHDKNGYLFIPEVHISKDLSSLIIPRITSAVVVGIPFCDLRST